MSSGRCRAIIALFPFGLGTVGQGIYLILERARNAHASISRICVRSLAKKRDIDIPANMLTDDPDDIFNDSSINLIVEVVDNAEPASWVSKASSILTYE